MAFVGEALLSALIETLVDKLASSDLLRFARHEEVLADIKKWENILKKIGAVLDDADDKQLTSRRVKMWLDDLRDLAYDVEDILDDFATEALGRTLTAEETLPSTSKVRRFIPSCCSCFTPSALKFSAKMRSKLDDIASRLQDISTQKNDLGLTNTITGGRPTTAREILPTTSLVDESRVWGRETDKSAIIDLLLQAHEPGGNAVDVIPIIGMGGLGKTTLAQLVYNDDKVKNGFDLRVWVCVSDDFDVVKLTETILLKVASDKPAANDLDHLQVKLKEGLSGKKKFLLVLDDVWNENGEKWDNFYKPIRTGVPGSKVIVTTRNAGVVSTIGGCSPYVLKQLSNDECLSLFAQQALGQRNFDEHPHLRNVGHQIVNKCKGLPLAAKTLGGMLRTKLNRDAWEVVLKSKIWDLPQDKNDILPALKLSYHYLPPHLKRCFVYCSIFPKDYKFDMHELVLLWMGEGFLAKGDKQMEELGVQYFNELLARSFFQPSNSYSSGYVMHDLVNDLAQFVAGDICFILEQKNEANWQQTISERVRHSSFIGQEYEISGKFEAYSRWKNLRTLLSLQAKNRLNWSNNYISVKVLYDLLKGMRFLRVLSLIGYQISEVPDFIGELKHLRYLNFSHCSIKRLPDSICRLYNLQSLVLASCNELIELPGGIGNLVNLRHLDISETHELQEIPFQIRNLTNLQTLRRFIVNRSGRLGIEGLKDLLNLGGELSISGLHEIENIENAREANLKDKQKIKTISLEWSDDLWDSRNEADESLVLESLQPHESLESLSIKFYGGSKFPNWIGDPTFSNLSRLTLQNCKRCSSLPSLGGLPSLEGLRIASMSQVKNIGGEFYGECRTPFASLKELNFENMPEWESWNHSNLITEDGRLFPSLKKLRIHGCPKLAGELPKDLPSLLELDVSECPELNLGGSMVALQELRIRDCGGLTCLFEGEEPELPCNLKFLCIDNCASLERLPNELHRLTCLEELEIKRCPKLELFTDTVGLPPMLRKLKVYDCQGLKLLPHNSSSSSSALESLRICRCPSLRGFPSGELPTTLKTLRIGDCENLESLPEGLMQPYHNSTCRLENLHISNCGSLKSFPRLKLPSTLKRLEIEACSNLEAISENMCPDSTTLKVLRLWNCPNLKTLSADCFHWLENLYLIDCEALECFPAGGLFTPTLRTLWIWSCENLKSLPHQMRNLQSLQNLSVSGCPGVESFPDGGLAPNLRSLIIDGCVNLKMPISEWGLHTLTSLSNLGIENMLPNLVSLSDEEYSPLPPSLTRLVIGGMESLASLPLHNLTSLEELWIYGCPKLRSFGRLPAKFRMLTIQECPGIKERCIKNKGDYWPNIAHIPRIELDAGDMDVQEWSPSQMGIWPPM